MFRIKHYQSLWLYSVWLLLLATALGGGLSSCMSDHRVHNRKEVKNVPEGAPVTLTLGLTAGDLGSEELRAAGINGLDKVQDLRVLVFDGKGRFLYSSDAVMGNVDPAPDGDEYYYPDAKQDNITQQKTFEVTLFQTQEPRILHFIANYNWNKVSQDYFLVGTSEGEFIAALETALAPAEGDGNDSEIGTTAFSTLWSRVEVSTDLANFNGSVIKMLRNYAKVTVELRGEAQDQLENVEFTLHNVPTCGAVAPFYTDYYQYTFPFRPIRPTLPSVMELREASETGSSWIGEASDFLLFEVPNDGAQKTSVMIKATRKVDPMQGATRYYKADLVVLEKVVGTEKRVNRYLPLVRNNEYRVVIRNANTEGYGSLAEAIQAPAGNNLFTSVEMQDFGSVSDGAFSLSVSPVSAVFVTPGTQSFSVFYSGVKKDNPTSYNYIQYYPNWNPDLDPLLGAITPITDHTGFPTGFTVEAKNIPRESIKEYYVDVVGLRQYQGTTIDGASGATSPILRRVSIILRPPFLFRAVLEPPVVGGGDVRDLSFDLPSSLPDVLFPFPIYIDAPEMTPDMGHEDARGKISIEYINGKAVYKYMVRTPDDLKKKRVSLPFRMNAGIAQNTEQPIVLSSPYYDTQQIRAENLVMVTSEFDLQYKLPYTDEYGYTPREELPTDTKFRFLFDGKEYATTEELEAKTGISWKYDDINQRWALSILEIRATDPDFMKKPLTIIPINKILFGHFFSDQYMDYTLSFYNYPTLQALWEAAEQDQVADLFVTQIDIMGHLHIKRTRWIGSVYVDMPDPTLYPPYIEGMGDSTAPLYTEGSTGKIRNPAFKMLPPADNPFVVDSEKIGWIFYTYYRYKATLFDPNGVVQNGLNFTFSRYDGAGYLVRLSELEVNQDINHWTEEGITSRS